MVLGWLKKWDALVFPDMARRRKRARGNRHDAEPETYAKVLLLTGPPGLGKTTLAHVCARQAGYEVLEINASDDRGRNVVNGQIRSCLGTQSIRTVSQGSKPARPVCVVVDEVDGAVSGSAASGEGGFISALVNLVVEGDSFAGGKGRSRASDGFEQKRPLILICNDLYHVSLRRLRQAGVAEIIHVGRPSLDAVVARLVSVFEREGIRCEKGAARKLCEAAWGMESSSRGRASLVEGDLRAIMVVGEWVAGRLRATAGTVLTRQWVEAYLAADLACSGGARGLARANTADIVRRLFCTGGGFPAPPAATRLVTTRLDEQLVPRAALGLGEHVKKHTLERLEHMVSASGDVGAILSGVVAEYPLCDYSDDCHLGRANQAYDWLHFFDACQTRLYASQEWQLAPYLSQPVLACHVLFASPRNHHLHHRPSDSADSSALPFSGPRADWLAHEAEKYARAQLHALHAHLPPRLVRALGSPGGLATLLVPLLLRIVSPQVRPVAVGPSASVVVRRQSERQLVLRACAVLAEVGVELRRGSVEGGGTQLVYRLEPDLDALSFFQTGAAPAPTRYAVRHVLHQELDRMLALKHAQARQARLGLGPAALPSTLAPGGGMPSLAAAAPLVKKDFFGRVVETSLVGEARQWQQPRVWFTFHEGLNNAVRKPMTLDEVMRVL
ncbi:hypothetical protein CDD81_7294 [Ophiocordyceps australis]|uniref:AAA+ ATPase domain-containing protein n=1 Tax=Ophiocordyceps australis TaxID=1399860 RepID=A0A2C5Y5J4_9HYPO|nr:hypothetical protein CDD81_7294 [Ophiocordyceps australis]